MIFGYFKKFRRKASPKVHAMTIRGMEREKHHHRRTARNLWHIVKRFVGLAAVVLAMSANGATTPNTRNIGVRKIVAGTNVTISPTTGEGTVTVNSTGGAGGITALTTDVTASGSGSVVATIAAGAVNTAKIATDAIDSTKIITGAVNTNKLSTDAVTGAKILNRTIDTAKLNQDIQNQLASIGGGSGITQLTSDVTAGPGSGSQAATIAAGRVDTGKIASDAVITSKILDLNVTTAKIAALAVDTSKLAADAVTTAKVLDLNITTAKIAALAVDTGKLAADAVIAAKIMDGSVNTNKIASDAITTAKLITSSVDTNKLASDAVTTAKLITAAVDTKKLAADSVTTAKIIDGSINTNKMTTGAIDSNKILNDSVTTATIINGAVDSTKISLTSVSTYSLTMSSGMYILAGTEDVLIEKVRSIQALMGGATLYRQVTETQGTGGTSDSTTTAGNYPQSNFDTYTVISTDVFCNAPVSSVTIKIPATLSTGTWRWAWDVYGMSATTGAPSIIFDGQENGQLYSYNNNNGGANGPFTGTSRGYCVLISSSVSITRFWLTTGGHHTYEGTFSVNYTDYSKVLLRHTGAVRQSASGTGAADVVYGSCEYDGPGAAAGSAPSQIAFSLPSFVNGAGTRVQGKWCGQITLQRIGR